MDASSTKNESWKSKPKHWKRSLAHVQIVKRREGARLVEVDIRYAHGSRKRVEQALTSLGYSQSNTSAIEGRNGTARRMTIYQVRKSLAFFRRPDAKRALSWWGVTVCNWCRRHRSLRQPLAKPQEKKVPAALATYGRRSRQSHFLNPRTLAHCCLFDKLPEIISHDYLLLSGQCNSKALFFANHVIGIFSRIVDCQLNPVDAASEPARMR